MRIPMWDRTSLEGTSRKSIDDLGCGHDFAGGGGSTSCVVVVGRGAGGVGVVEVVVVVASSY